MVRSSARALVPPIVAYCASRLVVWVALLVAPVLSPGYVRSRFFLDWDAEHYFFIAGHGYPPLYPPGGGYMAQVAYFPLLAWLTRWLDFVTPLSLRQSGIVIVNVAALAAVIALWLLASSTLEDHHQATRAAVFFSLWPASYVFSMFYSDALLVLFGALCLLALRRRQWLLAGVSAMLSSASRPNGIVLVASCAFCAVVAARETRSLRPFIAPLLAPLGMVGYFLFLQVRMGDFLLWFKAEHQGWGGGFDFGRHFVRDLVIEGFRQPTVRFDLLLSGTAGLVGIALLVWAIRIRLPVEQLLYAGGVLVLALGASFGASVPRYVLDAFPLFFAPAARLRGEWLAAAAIASAGALACVTLVAATTRVLTP